MLSIGIDLGTNSSCVSVFRNGEVEIIADEQGNTTTPSFVAFQDIKSFIGNADNGNDQTAVNAENAVYSAKKLIGQKMEEEINCHYIPEDIATVLLTKLKKTAETHLDTTVGEAIIAVPPNFDDSQLQIIINAGIKAEFSAVRTVNESSAAVLAYGFQKNPKGKRNILIFDMGAGFLNVSIWTIYEGLLFEVKATVGDASLGGEDFVKRLVKHLVVQFEHEYNKNLGSNLRASHLLYTAAERAKCDLSTSNEAVIRIDALDEENCFYHKINRAQFEELCEDLFQNTLRLVEKALNTAQMNKEQIQDIILIGGSTRIPKVQSLLQKFFSGKSLEDSISPDEAIAYGSAIKAAILRGDKSKDIQNVLVADQVFLRGNLIILACKENKLKALEYLFQMYTNECTNNFAILPNDEDEACHNAFYYAVRSGNIKLLKTLINNWPKNYFVVNSKTLDEILSKSYEELKLKNVPLSEEMQIFVENKLIDLRFYADPSDQSQNLNKVNLTNIRQRIDMILEIIEFLKGNCSNTQNVDEQFLLRIKFIAQIIHVLKRQLKSTYDSLPWEEMEFCLVSFVCSHIKRKEVNLFSKCVLNKAKILNFLENFAKLLTKQKEFLKNVDYRKLACLPKLRREKVVAKIIRKSPDLLELYNDYQKIRDIFSLEKIQAYIILVLTADAKERGGQLVIIRALQVIGECLKNTLEAPKMSRASSELLLQSLPKNTRKIVIDLRNSLSHAYSLSKRTAIEKNTSVNYFIGIKDDISKIANVVSDVFLSIKVAMVKTLLNQIVNSENIDEIKEIAETFSEFELKNVTKTSFVDELSVKMCDIIKEKTYYEEELFKIIESMHKSFKNNFDKIHVDYVRSLNALKNLEASFNGNKSDQEYIKRVQMSASKMLCSLKTQIEPQNLEEIAEISKRIYQSACFRLNSNDLHKVDELLNRILYIAEYGKSNFKWIEEFKDDLVEDNLFTLTQKQKITYELEAKELESKLSELKNILEKNNLINKPAEGFIYYKKNNELQATVEMLLLDIMSLLETSEKYLDNNRFSIDESTPLLTGKYLRNHLAHDNYLVDILLLDPSIAIILNAKKLISENVIKSQRKIGKIVPDDPCKLLTKHQESLMVIGNQENMFAALVAGNLEEIKNCLSKGADIKARNKKSSTALHFAAHGGSLEVIRFLLDHKLDVNVKDEKGQSPIHVAAACGKKNIVELFITELGVNIDEEDNEGRTPMHFAAKNGHMDTIVVLLKYNANTGAHPFIGYSPLHYAIKSNHIDVARILLGKELNVDSNEAIGGATSLYLAAEAGHLELVNFLIENGAKVESKCDNGKTPLHISALNGHTEVVKALICNGAEVNSKVLDGCTPLHYAIEIGNEEIVKILLSHGASVNIVDKAFHYSPLHISAKGGHVQITLDLLQNKANAELASLSGETPLHLAVQSGSLQTVVTLLEHGAKLRAQNKNKTTPLLYACQSGHKEIVELLIKNNAKVNHRDIKKQAPLHVAALNGRKDIVELLIRNQADAKALDSSCATPLHAASINGNTEIINALLNENVELNDQTLDGITPLHAAVLGGHEDAVALLIKHKAEVNTKTRNGFTPLHAAMEVGKINIVNILISNKAKVNALSADGCTPLHVAAKAGNKHIVATLLANGANVDAEHENQTPLISAIERNHVDVVKMLIKSGANVNFENGEPLRIAVVNGFRNIVQILLESRSRINVGDHRGTTALHLAALNGHKAIVKALIKGGANIDDEAIHLATKNGHIEILEVLIEKRGNVAKNAQEKMHKCSPLHIAAACGNTDVTKVLLKSGADIRVKNPKGFTPVENAIINGHLEVLEILHKHENIDIYAKDKNGNTLLHLASVNNRCEIVKYLVNRGCNIHAQNNKGQKPAHIAAIRGFIKVVEFFLSHGLSVDELTQDNLTLLHCSSMFGGPDLVRYLISQGADVNAKGPKVNTPLHYAVLRDSKDITQILLENGGFFDVFNALGLKPLDCAENKEVRHLLEATESLFNSVKANDALKTENDIKVGAVVNAKNFEGQTPLHYAARNANDTMIRILLQNNADPNKYNGDKCTPIHIAASISSFSVVKALLSFGAIYNLATKSGNTPADLNKSKEINQLLKTIDESFEKVKQSNVQVIEDLDKIQDLDVLRAVMGAHNSNKKSLLAAAMLSDFPKLQDLKDIAQAEVVKDIKLAAELLSQENYEKSLKTFRSAFKKNLKNVGPNNPATLEIQKFIAHVLQAKGDCREALSMLEDIFQKQKEMFGVHSKETLSTRSSIALVLHDQVKNEESLKIFKQVYEKQNELLGPNHQDTLTTQYHMTLPLKRLGKYEEALSISQDVYEKLKEINGEFHENTLTSLSAIGQLLGTLKKHKECLKIQEEVFEKKKQIYGINHSETLSTLKIIAHAKLSQKRYNETLKIFQEILGLQQKTLGDNHRETLITKSDIAIVYFCQSKWNTALRAYKECLDQMKYVFEPNHPCILHCKEQIELVKTQIQLNGDKVSEVLQHSQKDIIISTSKRDSAKIESLLKDGADVNDKDVNGRTSLHYAVDNEDLNILNLLLKYGADVTRASNKGNTPLHIASLKGNKEIVEILLMHVNKTKLNDFVNAKTASSGSTALHVAANGGHLAVVRYLLKHGAIFSAKNKEGKTPLGVTKNEQVMRLLKTVEKSFYDVEQGNIEVVSLMITFDLEDYFSIVFAQNDEGKTLMEAAQENGNLNGELAKSMVKTVLKDNTNIRKVMSSVKHDAYCDEDLKNFEKDLNVAVFENNTKHVEHLLAGGANANVKDIEGKTPIHFAVNNEHISIITILLKNGADVTQATKKGYTALHTACSKGNRIIVETLLNHVCRNKLNDFINAITIFSASTALHVAAKGGHLDVVKCLLKYGANFSAKNNEDKTPFDLSNDQQVANILQTTDNFFKDVTCGKVDVINKLKALKSEEFSAITSARNNEGKTLLQVAIGNRDIANKLLQLLKIRSN